MSCLLHTFLCNRFKILPAAFCKAHLVFLMIFCLYMTLVWHLYIILCHIYRIIMEQHELDTFTTLTVLDWIYLPGDIHHPGAGSRLNLLRIFRIPQLFL